MLWHSVFCIYSFFFGFFVGKGKIGWTLAKLTRNIMSCLFLKAWAGINRGSGVLEQVLNTCLQKSGCLSDRIHWSSVQGICWLHCLWQPSIVSSDCVPAVDAASPQAHFLSPDHLCACVYSKIFIFASNMHCVFSRNCISIVLKSLSCGGNLFAQSHALGWNMLVR